MLHRTLLAGAVVAALLAGNGTAFAQAVVETPPTPYVVPAAPPVPYDDDYDAGPPSSPVFRDYPYDAIPDEEVVVVGPRPRVCGPGSYWTGDGCVYAPW
ncbi:MAG: hypothetical protein J2P50_17845 [Hyphomicrobiaceae bacterium]|nr:hypothetical protein [Hyphomicrobiaceae bacterium]